MLQSPRFLHVQAQCDVATKQAAEAQANFERLERDMSAAILLRRVQLEALEAEEAGRRRLLEAEVQRLLGELSKMKSAYDQLVFEREQRVAQEEPIERNKEMRQLIAVLQEQNARLSKELRQRKPTEAHNDAEPVRAGAASDASTAAGAPVEQLRMQLAAKEENERVLVTELEAVGNAFQAVQEQNARLLRQLNAQDDTNAQIAMDVRHCAEAARQSARRTLTYACAAAATATRVAPEGGQNVAVVEGTARDH